MNYIFAIVFFKLTRLSVTICVIIHIVMLTTTKLTIDGLKALQGDICGQKASCIKPGS